MRYLRFFHPRYPASNLYSIAIRGPEGGTNGLAFRSVGTDLPHPRLNGVSEVT